MQPGCASHVLRLKPSYFVIVRLCLFSGRPERLVIIDQRPQGYQMIGKKNIAGGVKTALEPNQRFVFSLSKSCLETRGTMKRKRGKGSVTFFFHVSQISIYRQV